MKLVRFGPPGQERPGVWIENAFPKMPGVPGLLDVRAMAFDIEDFNPQFFTHWGIERVRRMLEEPGRKLVPGLGMRLGPPIARPGQIVCIGKNYADHAKEMGGEAPPAPVLFAKAVATLNGPTDPIVIPPEAQAVDAEAELAVVIGTRARRVAEADALRFVAGYATFNDVTDRVAQKEAGQWFRGKSFDSFGPLGPFLVTADEIPDPQKLAVRQRLGGETLQDGNTAQMIFSVAQLIAYITRTMTLEPGDLIATGTPAGIGSARTPPRLIRAGDTVEVEVEGLGAQKNPAVAEKTAG